MTFRTSIRMFIASGMAFLFAPFALFAPSLAAILLVVTPFGFGAWAAESEMAKRPPAAGRAQTGNAPQSASPIPARNPSKDSANLAHFEKKIRPVLKAHCYECHAADSQEIKGGLVLDTRAGLLEGGDSGPAIVPGNAKGSLLIAAIRHEGGLQMPPKNKLTVAQINDFVQWVDSGAVDPREGHAAKPTAAIDIKQSRQYWAFQRPVRKPTPEMKDMAWPLTDVDRFIRAAQEQHGVSCAADALPGTLVRRLYFDLIGLPPTPEQAEQFEHGCRTGGPQALQTTLERTVDHLLDSPHFGERWGRHWLDVARYSESSGKEANHTYPYAWRYRDYVIDSLNADTPFDQFIREQIAGDLLPAADDFQRAEQIVATGFLALGPKTHTERNKKKFELDLVDEQIDTLSQAFLGLTVACARCHDHKFDPIPQEDYYALAGIFRSTETLYGTIPVITNANPSELWTLPSGADLPEALPPLTATNKRRLERLLDDARTKSRELTRNRQSGTQEIVRSRIILSTLEAKLNAYHTDGTPKALAMGVRDRVVARDSELHIRGEVERPGRTVPRGFVQVLCDADVPTVSSGSGRLELANWLASKDNPLTARVFVNRVWLHLFGRGLVPTPDNFGAAGQQPSHPELLDYLAIKFVEDGWSVKRLIRYLVLSRAYRQDSAFHDANHALDPDNVWLWRVSPRRLDAESIRDAMLAMAGKLDLKPQAGSAIALSGEGFAGVVERGRQLDEQRFQCRAVYLPVMRGRILESLEEFDGVDGAAVVGHRPETTVPSQSLYLLNSPFVLSLATNAAERLMTESRDSRQRVDLAYRRWFGRLPTDSESTAALSFISRYQQQAKSEWRTAIRSEAAAWTAFCQSLWASSEFLVRK